MVTIFYVYSVFASLYFIFFFQRTTNDNEHIDQFITLKLMTHGILHYLWSADLSKSFSQLNMSIFIFSQYFFQYILPGGKVWGYLTLLIS